MKTFKIAKTEPDKMLVFGWGNVAIDENGVQLTDLQGDVIDTEDLEKAAYDHVLNFRSTGERHNPELRKKGRLVESCVFTKEKQAAIGIPPGTVPEGWWVGYKIDDPTAWEKIKSGEYLSFSVEGKGRRTPIEKANLNFEDFPSYDMWLEKNLSSTKEEQDAAKAYYGVKDRRTVAKTYDELRKFNPYHDARGRFAPKEISDHARSEWMMNRGSLKEIAEAKVIKDIISENEYDNYGIRIQEEDTEQIGHAMNHRSVNAGGDFDDPEKGLDDIAGELEGVSAIDVSRINEVGEYGGYPGTVAYLLGSNGYGADGYDPGEIVMTAPTVLAKIVVKDGKPSIIEHVDTQQKPEQQEKNKPEHKKTENPGYTEFMAQMAQKYGEGKMWGDMDDKEFDQAQWWENHRYDPVKKSVAKSYAEMRKFNPYHDSRGRFSTANSYASFTARTRDPAKQHMADAAVAREKKRQAAAAASAPSTASTASPAASKTTTAPKKPKVNVDANGFRDYDDADFHQLYNGSGYYQQQNLSAAVKQQLTNYLNPNTERGSLYNFSQNMNWAAATGTINQNQRYKKAFDTIVGSMHNLGHNVTLTRYDHGEFLDNQLAAAGIRGGHKGMSVAQMKSALVGRTYGDKRILSTSYNDFSQASNHQVFTTREVKITYRAKAGTKALMPGDGPGGKFGEMLLAPTSGKTNNYTIVDVRATGNKARGKGQPRNALNLNQIEVIVEVG